MEREWLNWVGFVFGEVAGLAPLISSEVLMLLVVDFWRAVEELSGSCDYFSYLLVLRCSLRGAEHDFSHHEICRQLRTRN